MKQQAWCPSYDPDVKVTRPEEAVVSPGAKRNIAGIRKIRRSSNSGMSHLISKRVSKRAVYCPRSMEAEGKVSVYF